MIPLDGEVSLEKKVYLFTVVLNGTLTDKPEMSHRRNLILSPKRTIRCNPHLKEELKEYFSFLPSFTNSCTFSKN